MVEDTLDTNGTGQLVAHVRWASNVRPMAKPQQARNQTPAARTHQGRPRRVDVAELEGTVFPNEYRTKYRFFEGCIRVILRMGA
jgi:hypothetical protein